MNSDQIAKPQTANKPRTAYGSTAGVESGLSSVQVLTRGDIQPEQVSSGENFRQNSVDSDAGSSDNGKNFKFRY